MPPSAKSKNFRLSKDVVEEISTLTAETLKEDNIESQAADRLHAVVEKVLQKWLDGLGEGAECSFRSGKKLGKQYITLIAAGPRVNPFGNDSDCVLNGGSSVQTLLANIGLAPSYHYVNGENQITIMPKRRKINPLIYLGIALVAGVLVGLFCHTLSDEMRHSLSEVLIGPLFDTFIGLLIATALPMMFLSLIWGIYSIGDTATLGTLGRKVIGRYFGRIYFTLVICTLVALPFFTFWKIQASPKMRIIFRITEMASTTNSSRSSAALLTISVSIRFSTLIKTISGRSVVIHSITNCTRLFACATNCTITGIFLFRISIARPNATARKIICRVFPSTKGEIRLSGMIPRSISRIAKNSPPPDVPPEKENVKNGSATSVQITSVK